MEIRIPSHLPGVRVISKKLRVVVTHLLKVWHEPALVDGIAVETSCQLVINTTARHLLKRCFDDSEEMLFFCLLVELKDQVNDGGMRKFRSAAKTAVLDVKLLGNRSDLSIHDAVIEFRTRTCENFRMRDCVCQMVRRADKLGPFIPVGVRNRKENPAKARPPHLIFRRKIRPAKKRLSIRQQKSRQRPATLAGNRAYGGLIA